MTDKVLNRSKYCPSEAGVQKGRGYDQTLCRAIMEKACVILGLAEEMNRGYSTFWNKDERFVIKNSVEVGPEPDKVSDVVGFVPAVKLVVEIPQEHFITHELGVPESAKYLN